MSFRSFSITLFAIVGTYFCSMFANDQEIFADHSSCLIEYICSKGYSCSIINVCRTEKEYSALASESYETINFCRESSLEINLNITDKLGRILSNMESFINFGLFWESLDDRNVWGGRSDFDVHVNCFIMHL